MGLDWGWSLGKSTSGTYTPVPPASTSGNDILRTLLGGGSDVTTNAQVNALPSSGGVVQRPAGTVTPHGSDGTVPPASNAINNGAVDPATGRPAGTVTPTARNTIDPQTATLPTYTPSPNSRWQGGAADPNGTQAANGRQTGGRYVDPTYQTDANGRPLTAAEQAGWKQYDVDRANASTREHDGYLAYKAAQAASAGGNGSKAVFDARSKTWSVYDPTAKKWEDNIAQADLLGKLSTDTRSQYPDWWWGQSAQGDIDQMQYQNQRYANQYEQQQAGGRQQVRYDNYGL